jgi:hypothetical protein
MGSVRAVRVSRTTVSGMRLAASAFGAALAGLLVLAASDVAAAAAGSATAALLVLLGYRDGSRRALRWALLVPAAAIVADALTFTPLSPQTGPEANLYTYGAFFYLPVWAVLVAVGIGVRRTVARGAHPQP